MHAHPDLTHGVINGLGWLYLLLFFANLAWTVRSFQRDGEFTSVFGFQHIPKATVWAFYAAFIGLLAVTHLVFNSDPESFLLRMPDGIKVIIDYFFSNATRYFSITMLAFVGMIVWRETITRDTVGWVIFNAAVLFLALSMTDYDFRQIVGKPDNVPIVGMLFIGGYFTWLYFKKAVDNDRRIAEGRPLAEQELKEQVLVWPDLVYTELVCMILLTALLIVWGVFLQAPLEEPGQAVKTPNPSKAPWYFLGLQEMLTMFHPMVAGVTIPGMGIFLLIIAPYVDKNPSNKPDDRKWAISMFTLFLMFWTILVIIGSFFRGTGFNFVFPWKNGIFFEL